MRKIPASLAVLGLVAVGLVGCSLPGSNACDRADDADASVLSGVTVSGETDEAPEVELYTPFHTDSAASEDVVVGEGLEITDDSQLIVMDRYENVQRITQIIRTLDVPSGSNVPPLRRE